MTVLWMTATPQAPVCKELPRVTATMDATPRLWGQPLSRIQDRSHDARHDARHVARHVAATTPDTTPGTTPGTTSPPETAPASSNCTKAVPQTRKTRPSTEHR